LLHDISNTGVNVILYERNRLNVTNELLVETMCTVYQMLDEIQYSADYGCCS